VLPDIFPWLSIFKTSGIVINVITSGSFLLVGTSMSALLSAPLRTSLAKSGVMLYIAEALVQLPVLLQIPWCLENWSYPASHTGFVTLFVQLPGSVLVITNGKQMPFHSRYFLASAAIACRYMALQLADTGGPGSWVLYTASAATCIFAITPRMAWQVIGDALAYIMKKLQKVALATMSVVYLVTNRVLPVLKQKLVAFLEHPYTRRVYQSVIRPVWTKTTPLVLPMATVASTYACGSAVCRSLSSGKFVTGIDSAATAVAEAFCMVGAGLASVVLVLHALYKLRSADHADPLRRKSFMSFLYVIARTMVTPWYLLKRAAYRFLWIAEPVLAHTGKFFNALTQLGLAHPFVMIPMVLLFNVGLLRLIYALDLSLPWPWPSASLSSKLTDPTVAIALIALTQLSAMCMVKWRLQRIKTIKIISAESHASGMTTEELMTLAATMANPRMCGSCFYGPVDARGCDNLRTHHHERSRGGRISNACPRCGWFASRLSQWPAWNDMVHTPAGLAVARQRCWGEVVLTLRAAAKATVVPYTVLRVALWLNLSPSISAWLALSYLVPWAYFNGRVLSMQEGSNPQPPRPYRGPAGGDDADCGAARRTPDLPPTSQAEALSNLLAATPAQVFLGSGDICSVCLETFPDTAAEIANTCTAEEASRKLASGEPPILALRCGHPLHTDCATSAVAAAGDRHVRCPLCREPVTTSGAAAARMFT